MSQTRILTSGEKAKLRSLLSQPQDTVMLIHGEGEFRQVSFYADGTRQETRLDYPDVKD